MTNTIEVFKNDDTNAFGRGFVRIKLKDADKINITRAVVSCGDFYKDYSNPVFPLDIDMNASETSKLRFSSYWYISIFDEYGRKHTFKKAFCIKALDEVTPTGEGVSNSALRTSNVETIEVENDLTTPLQEITIEFNMAPDKLSQLEDDVQLESRLTSLSEILDSLIQREYTIPKKTSDLINDSGFLTSHQDISGKVDKVTGKGLSTEDYTTAEKTKLAGLSNYDDTQIIEALDGKADVNHTHSQYLTEHQDISGKVDKVTGKGLSTEDYTTEEKTKLAGLSNYDDTQIIEALDGKADVNHTHSQYLTEHQDISRKVDKVTGKGLSTNDFTDSYKNKLDNAITGIKMNDATVGTSGLVDLGNVMTIQGNIGDFTSVDSLNLGLYYFDNVSNSQLPVTTNASGFLIAYGYYGQVCLVGNKMYYRQNDRSLGRFGNWQVAITNSDLFVKQDKANLVTSLSASSTDTQYPSAKCVYNIVGDIETALNTINSGVSS